ncbi:hypothetical protein FQN51_000757 [Onygenales sp. PD_10]|nr:hypothetical protein FQN51_000757 [Onygenales sp. PD_10]
MPDDKESTTSPSTGGWKHRNDNDNDYTNNDTPPTPPIPPPASRTNGDGRPPLHPHPHPRPPSLEFTPIRSTPSLSQHDNPLTPRRPVTATATTSSLSLSRSQDPEWQAIHRAMSKMFGRQRQAESEEEKTRHVGVVWKGLSVRGVGMGAAVAGTIGDVFLGVPRAVRGLVGLGGGGVGRGKGKGKKSVRTILDGFTGCVRPGEMLLVLGRPGSGCSTFLKAIGNQRAGYESVEGEVTYGGTDAETMAKNYRSEVLYNPEDDLHYPSLTVRDTLNFALKTRTPGKEGRNQGETRAEYRRTFLQSVAKLFWIEHCLDTKVGGDIVRGVSGGEKKRVSIAEALITKASTQCWDGSTRGLDANTSLEFVQSLRSVTDMAQVSTLVAIYQASESLYRLMDKVILLDGGKCIYFGRTAGAKAYFEGLGFECPPRWTTADFLTSVTEPHARRIKEGWESRVPRSSEQFQEAYRNSEAYKAALQDVEEFEQETKGQAKEREAAMSTATKRKNFTIPFHQQVIALSHRQFLIMVGDKQSLFGKWSVILFLALIVGSLFYNLPDNSRMRPWLKWLIWINPVQYAFESIMSNEFYKLALQCVPPFLVPQGPRAAPEYQSCLVQGSKPGETVVQGANYIKSNFTYTRSHLWRNFGIIVAWFVLFVTTTMIGTEMQKEGYGGRTVTVFLRGQAPASVERDMKNGSRAHDEEMGEKRSESQANGDDFNSASSSSGEVQGIAKNAAIFTWRNVNYKIPYKGGEKMLLQDVQGYVRPGRLTALVGASGAGKTTLLNALAQRIDFGVLTGEFLIDGRPLPKSFQGGTGFAQQADIHEPTATVREALQFSALLRRPKDVPIKEKYDYCERILDLLELRPLAGAIIGEVGTGLNQEQRKRVTIAIELASKPELLLFLDEPTSGLDSLASLNIVRFLRKLADVGQAVLCTIHQPSAVLFEQFDELLLLQSGGRVVYHGELGQDSRSLIDYFESNGGKKCPPDANPAEYMLEVIGAGNPDYVGQDWGDVWANSPEYQNRSDEIRDMIESRKDSGVGRRYNESEFAMPLWIQAVAVTKRTFIAYWRTPNYAIGKFMLQIWTGLFNTFTFWHLGSSTIDMQSRLFSCFMTLVIAPPLIQQLQPKFLHFRGIFEARESSSKIYSWFAFVTSAILPELPYSVVAGYFGTWFPRNSFSVGITWMFMMLFSCFYVGFGQMIAAFSPNELFASLLVPAFFTFVVSFCGIVVPYANLPYFWRSWMYWLTPFHYLLEGFLGIVTHQVPVKCRENEYAKFRPPPGMSCEEYAGPMTRRIGGYVATEADGLCAYCQYANGNQFAASFNVFYRHKWRNYVR